MTGKAASADLEVAKQRVATLPSKFSILTKLVYIGNECCSTHRSLKKKRQYQGSKLLKINWVFCLVAMFWEMWSSSPYWCIITRIYGLWAVIVRIIFLSFGKQIKKPWWQCLCSRIGSHKIFALFEGLLCQKEPQQQNTANPG